MLDASLSSPVHQETLARQVSQSKRLEARSRTAVLETLQLSREYSRSENKDHTQRRAVNFKAPWCSMEKAYLAQITAQCFAY